MVIRRILTVLLMVAPSVAAGQTGAGPFARLTIIRPGKAADAAFEAGYQRHLEWHRQHRDPWAWYGWTVAFGERLDWFIDGTFGHSAASLDSSVAPAADGADNALNVAPHAEFLASSIYQFLPELSGGSGDPPASPLLELVTYDLQAGAGPAFEQAIREQAAGAESGTRWFRLVAGGPVPRYLRMRPRASLAAVAAGPGPDPATAALVRRTTTDILRFRRELSLGVEPAR